MKFLIIISKGTITYGNFKTKFGNSSTFNDKRRSRYQFAFNFNENNLFHFQSKIQFYYVLSCKLKWS